MVEINTRKAASREEREKDLRESLEFAREHFFAATPLGHALADQPGLVGEHDELGPVSRAELGEEPRHVGLGRER